MSDLSRIEQQFHTLCTELAGEFCSLRIVHSRSEYLSVRRGVVQPPHQNEDLGAMVTVFDKAGGAGYAATSDLSANGLRRAPRPAPGPRPAPRTA